MPDIHGVGGEKGGVGKSTVCKRILEYESVTENRIEGRTIDPVKEVDITPQRGNRAA